jgi:hypothetical protein
MDWAQFLKFAAWVQLAWVPIDWFLVPPENGRNALLVSDLLIAVGCRGAAYYLDRKATRRAGQ